MPPGTESNGNSNHPYRVAIVGAGPAGFYTAAALLAQAPADGELPITIDLLDRLPTPYGLVRYGVAPDHPKIKEVVRVFERVALDARVRFLGNLELGRDLSLADLSSHYDQVVLALGGQSDRRLDVPGEDLAGSHSSTALVAWYSSHPDFVDLPVDLGVEAAAVVGAGNVAVDVVRILGRDPRDLATTDIADFALEALGASKVRDVHMLVRRGPVQAKWSAAELKELAHLEGVDLVVDPADLELDEESRRELAEDPQAQKCLEILAAAAAAGPTGAARRIHLHFLRSPLEIVDADGKVAGLRVAHNRLHPTARGLAPEPTGETSLLPVGLVVRAVGYRSLPIGDVPFDPKRAIVPNAQGRVTDGVGGRTIPGLYVAGWLKRGPTGLIGSNKLDGAETATAMLEDLPTSAPAAEGAIDDLLAARNLRVVDFAAWKRIDRMEAEKGQPAGRPRVKFARIHEMLAALES